MTPLPLTLRLFGPFRAQVGGKPLPRLRTRSLEWLLALLALRHGRAVDRTWLSGTLWTESEAGQALSLVVVEVNACLARRQIVGQYVGRSHGAWSVTRVSGNVACVSAVRVTLV